MAKKREKRSAGVMFVDIARFLDATRAWSDEDLAEFLQDFYKDLGDVVVEHSGRIVKYMGDSMLVTFEPDHLDDAIRCAEALQESFSSFCQGRNVSMGLSIGLHYDEVIAGHFGHSTCETTDVLGKGVMLAGLICGEGVRLSDAAYERLTSKMDTTRTQVEVSWRDAPITVHALPVAGRTPSKPLKRF